jgi:hypothetical protein
LQKNKLLKKILQLTIPSKLQCRSTLSSRPEYAGPRDATNKVTPELLFRGGLGTTFAGETAGPYLSQFLLLPTQLGSLPITQQYLTNKANMPAFIVIQSNEHRIRRS